MMLLLVIACVCSVSWRTNAQSSYFNNTYDFYGNFEVAWNVEVLDSGYYIVGGVGDSITGLGRIGIMYIDTSGNEIWKKSYGQGNFYYYTGLIGSFSSTEDGGYILGGSISYSGGDDAMLWRFNSNGDTLWTRIYKDTSVWDVAYNCKQTKDSGFILVGGKSAGILLIKTDSMGNMEWQKTYGAGAGVSVDICNDGGYIIGGDLSGSNNQSYVMKVDSSGNFQWSRTFGGAYDENPVVVIATSDGGYILAGDTAHYKKGSWTYKQLHLIKLDSNGNTEWERSYGPVWPLTTLTSVRELPDGNFIAVGQAAVPIIPANTPIGGVLLKINSSGDNLWLKYYRKFGGYSSNYFRDVQYTNDGGFVVAGFVVSEQVPIGVQDMWVMKLDSFGLCNDSILCYDITNKNDCNYFRTDTNTLYFDHYVDTGLTVIFSWGNISKYATRNTWDFGDGQTDTTWFFYADSVTHTYDSAGTYIVTLIVTDAEPYGPYNYCVDTISNTVIVNQVGISDIKRSNFVFKISPNPFSQSTTIEIKTTNSNFPYSFTLYDQLGRRVKQIKEVRNEKIEISRKGLSDGIFFYIIKNKEEQGIGKGKLIIITP